MAEIICINCRRPYPDTGVPFRCVTCGGLYDYNTFWRFDPFQVDLDQPGIWKYQHTFGLMQDASIVSMAEGNTPLVWSQVAEKKVAFKLEYLNPTGSFKDRGSTILVSHLKSRGVDIAVEDSSGNAGASFAAYSARGGIRVRIYIPDYTSGPKRQQIEVYGAELVPVLGPRSNAAKAVQRAAVNGVIYASHAYLPHGLPGYATVSYELVEQLGEAPGTVVIPVGQGSLLLGAARGFLALMEANIISRLPRLVGVQARACAPLWALSSYGPAGLGWVSEGETIAEGIRIKHPLRGDMVLKVVEASQGFFLAIDEEEIRRGVEALAKLGFYVEPTSATVFAALAQLPGDAPEPVVAILTGSGYKNRLI